MCNDVMMAVITVLRFWRRVRLVACSHHHHIPLVTGQHSRANVMMIIIINGAVIMTKVIARVHPVHLMNVD